MRVRSALDAEWEVPFDSNRLLMSSESALKLVSGVKTASKTILLRVFLTMKKVEAE